MYKIERVDVRKTNKNPSKKYPFAEMQVDDSFLVSADEVAMAYQAAWQYGTRHNKKFGRAKQDDGSFRVYRKQ